MSICWRFGKREFLPRKGALVNLLCIDPGTTTSGVVVIDTETKELSGIEPALDNRELIRRIPFFYAKVCDRMAYEMIASMGMTVGKSTFETVIWMGRFAERFGFDKSDRVYRMDVKLSLCGQARAKDKNIRQAILDLYEPTGGGTTPQIGTKKQPGPLYGVSRHAWSALAVGLTWINQREEKKWKQQA